MSGNIGMRTDAEIANYMAVKDGRKSRWFELFGTPERTARTLQADSMSCKYCLLGDYCKDGICLIDDYDALIEWLRGDAE